MKRLAEDDHTADSVSTIDSDSDTSSSEEEDNCIQRERWLLEELSKEHGVDIELLRDEDLVELDNHLTVGDVNGLHCRKLTHKCVVEMIQLSHNDIDLFGVAKKGSLFGLTYSNKRPITTCLKIRYPRCNVTHCIFKSGTFIVTGRSSHAREKVLSHTIALLRYICGLNELVINDRHCQNIIANATLNQALPTAGMSEMCMLLGIPYDEAPIVLHYRNLLMAEKLSSESANILFIINPHNGNLVCIGGKSPKAVIDAIELLLNHILQYIGIMIHKKRRIS